MATSDEEKAAADKAAADAAKAAAEKDKGPTPEERQAADERRQAAEKVQQEKIDTAEAKLVDLDKKIKTLRDQQAEAAKKGKDTQDLEARLAEAERRQVDSEKLLIDLHEREKAAIERANVKTLETDLRTTLADKLVDAESTSFAVDMLIAKGKVRVDADGKVAVVDQAGKWASLSPEAVLAHVPNALKAPKGVPGGGTHAPAGEVASSDALREGLNSQEAFNRLTAEGKIPDGSKRQFTVTG